MAASKPSTEGARKALGDLGSLDGWIRRTLLLCAALVAVKIGFLLFSHAWGHAHFSFEAWPGFFEAVGFFGFALLVLMGRALGPLVRRPEEYYDPELSRRAVEEGADHA